MSEEIISKILYLTKSCEPSTQRYSSSNILKQNPVYKIGSSIEKFARE